MKKLLFNPAGHLRHGWWIPLFIVSLGAMLVAMTALFSPAGKLPAGHQVIAVLALTAACQWIRREPLSRVLGTMEPGAAWQFLAGCLAGLLLMLVPAAFLAAGGWVHFELSGSWQSALVPGLLALLPAVIVEELFFRGFLFRRLVAGLGAAPGLLLTSAFFLLTHLDNQGMNGTAKLLAAPNIFIASVVFGLACLRTGGLAMPIGMHLGANFFQSTVLGFGVSGNTLPSVLVPLSPDAPSWMTGGAFGLEASAPGLLAIIGLAYLMRHKYRKTPQ